MTDDPARHAEGANLPPPETDPLRDRLSQDHSALIDGAADLELESFTLPELVNDDEQAAAVSDHVMKVKRLAARVESTRVEEKEPYLKSGRTVDGFFAQIANPLTARVASLTQRVNAYQKAKAAREQAERAERERVEREAAETARRAEQQARDDAERARKESEAAAARLRSAADAQDRAEQEAQMRAAEQERLAKNAEADAAAADAAAADRVADTHGKAAAAPIGALSRVTSAGSTAGASKFWNHRIKDGEALFLSLGPLGKWISNDAIMQAIAAAKREHIAADTIKELVIPGVEIFEDTRTTIREGKKPKA